MPKHHKVTTKKPLSTGQQTAVGVVPPAKRLAPRLETLRELFLKSGNLCAFPGCTEFMMDVDGVFVGEICHIEAAEEGGERFNSSQSNEDRRSFANLMLMCHRHHVRTDNVTKYPVDALVRMKAEHEAKFSDPALAMSRTLVDETTQAEVGRAITLERIAKELRWNLSREQRLESVEEINELLERMKLVPVNARKLVEIVLTRVIAVDSTSDNPKLLFSELAAVCNMSPTDLANLTKILERHRIVWIDDDYDDQNPYIALRDLRSGWHVWTDLAEFSSKTGIPLPSLIVDLEFDRLD